MTTTPSRCILLTGAAGSLGSAAATRLLAAGHRVRGLDLRQGEQPGVDWRIGDLGHADALAPFLTGIDVVVHLGAVPSHGPMDQIDWWPKLWRANVDGTFNLFFAAAQAGVKEVIYASSISALHGNGNVTHTAATLKSLPITDSDPYARPVEPYVASKQINELTAEMFVNRGLFTKAIGLRFGMIGVVGNPPDTSRLAVTHKYPLFNAVDRADAAVAIERAVATPIIGNHAMLITSRYRYAMDGRRMNPAETVAELHARGAGDIPRKPGFPDIEQVSASSRLAQERIGYDPVY